MDFKEWMEGRIKFAHVGASRNPSNPEFGLFHDDDQWKIDTVADWLGNNHPEIFNKPNFEHDFIDLNDGNDFLKNKNKYDIVILHMVYSPSHGSSRSRLSGDDRIFNISPDHSPENWRHSNQ